MSLTLASTVARSALMALASLITDQDGVLLLLLVDAPLQLSDNLLYLLSLDARGLSTLLQSTQLLSQWVHLQHLSIAKLEGEDCILTENDNTFLRHNLSSNAKYMKSPTHSSSIPYVHKVHIRKSLLL